MIDIDSGQTLDCVKGNERFNFNQKNVVWIFFQKLIHRENQEHFYH
jgi:hypothetical protein